MQRGRISDWRRWRENREQKEKASRACGGWEGRGWGGQGMRARDNGIEG